MFTKNRKYIVAIASLSCLLFSCKREVQNDNIRQDDRRVDAFDTKANVSQFNEHEINNPLRNRGKYLGFRYNIDVNGTHVSYKRPPYRWDIGSDQFPLKGDGVREPTPPRTLITKTICDESCDFTTVSDWIIYLQSDHGQGPGVLTSPQLGTVTGEIAEQIIVFENITTSLKNYVELSGFNKHDGRSNTVSGLDNARLKIDGPVTVDIEHFGLSWLEINSSLPTDSSGKIHIIAQTGYIAIHHNILNGNGLSDNQEHFSIKVDAGDNTLLDIYRNTIYGYAGGINISTSGQAKVYNNSVFGCSYAGIESLSANVEVVNNACFNNGKDFNIVAGVFMYNASSDETSIGENSLNNQPLQDYYLNPVNNWAQTDLTRKVMDSIDTNPPPEGYVRIMGNISDIAGNPIEGVEIRVRTWYDADDDNDIDKDDLAIIRQSITGPGVPVVRPGDE
jgi:hypothetical protein